MKWRKEDHEGPRAQTSCGNYARQGEADDDDDGTIPDHDLEPGRGTPNWLRG